MTTLDLYLFLTSYTWTVAAACLTDFLWKRKSNLLIPTALVVALLISNTVVGSHLVPDKSYLDVVRYLITETDLSSLVALLMGFAVGYIWLIRRVTSDDLSLPASSGGDRSIDANLPASPSRWQPTWLAISSLCVIACGHAFLWKDVTGTTRHVAKVQAPEFVIEQIADLDEQPLRITTDADGSIYVCFDYFRKHGAWGGAILQFRLNPETGQYEKRTVVESPLLARCYGLAVHNGDLYVSRSGYSPQAKMGQVTYEPTGAITQLRDLDGDGYFEYANDVVTGLPGVRAPDTMQQNNGLVFGPDGSLYVTNASAADRTLDEHLWGGAILRYNADFSGPEIVAKGFRNPWSIAFGPDNSQFVTDSDVDKNPGDEINHVIAGEHYGHPFVIPNEPGVQAVGFREPILVGERETVFLGLVYATASTLPDKYRDCMYTTDFRLNRVLRLNLERVGETYKVTQVTPFAQIPSPVDMAIGPAGDFFVISRRAQKLYRIRLKN